MTSAMSFLFFPVHESSGYQAATGRDCQQPHYNLSRPDVVVMAITSQLHASSACGEVVVATWQAAHLLKPSAIKPVFATLEQALLLRTLGTLTPSDQKSLVTATSEILG